MSDNKLREIPSVSELLDACHRSWGNLYLHDDLVEAIREALEDARGRIKESGRALPDLEKLVAGIRQRLERMTQPSLRRVINATGIIVHTNLGRAPLARAAVERIADLSGYSNLEFDIAQGKRGNRDYHLERAFARLLPVEASLVVNNNAAALFLILNTLAEGKEVLVSRGELVEIGGSFRLPEIMRKSGALLREVGTTNRTRVKDYAEALNEN